MASTPIENTTYTPAPPPVIDPTSPLYLQTELRKIQKALTSITEILKKLDARLTAGGL